jgi:hypothetical protein
LKTAGLRGAGLWALYLAAALPFAGAVARCALDPARPVGDVLALSLLAAFFVVPYARAYDFPVLLVPLLALLGGRLPQAGGAVVLLFLLLAPHAFLLGFPSRAAANNYTLFLIPLVLTAAWLVPSRPKPAAPRLSGQGLSPG